MIVVDTDLMSRIRKRTVPADFVGHLAGKRLYVTFVTVGGLTAWSLGHGWGDRRRAEFEQWLDGFLVLPYRPSVAKRWGTLTATGRRLGRTPPVNDTWLAAACIEAGLPLATLNVRDFAHHAAHGGLRLIAA